MCFSNVPVPQQRPLHDISSKIENNTTYRLLHLSRVKGNISGVISVAVFKCTKCNERIQQGHIEPRRKLNKSYLLGVAFWVFLKPTCVCPSYLYGDDDLCCLARPSVYIVVVL